MSRGSVGRRKTIPGKAIYTKSGESFLPSHTFFDLDGLRIAVFGFSPVTTPVTTHPKNVANLTFRDPLEAAAELVPKLREHADLVFAVNHIGFEDDRALAVAVPGIDVIVGGHSHTQLDYPVKVADSAAMSTTRASSSIDVEYS